MLQQHVVIWSQANARPHDVDEATPLRKQGVDNGRARWHEWCLDEEAEDGEHGVEALEVGRALAAHL